MSGSKTHEQLMRILERKPDVPRPAEFDPGEMAGGCRGTGKSENPNIR